MPANASTMRSRSLSPTGRRTRSRTRRPNSMHGGQRPSNFASRFSMNALIPSCMVRAEFSECRALLDRSQRRYSKYPPAEPGALEMGPLKAALIILARLHMLGRRGLGLLPDLTFVLEREQSIWNALGYSYPLSFGLVYREASFRVRGGSRVGSFIDRRLR
jgi:hypothetical protein